MACLHTAIPTHWLPFVLAARAQSWSPVERYESAILGGLLLALSLIVVAFEI